MAKDFWSELWEVSEIPVYALVLWNVISIILTGFLGVNAASLQAVNWLVIIGAFGYLGYLATKVHKKGIAFSAKAGAFVGVIVGLAGAIIAILAFYSVPGYQAQTVDYLIQSGLDMEQAQNMASVGLYIAIITSPIISGIIGTIFAAIGGYISDRFF